VVDNFDDDWPRIVPMSNVRILELSGVEMAHKFVASFPNLRTLKASQNYLTYVVTSLHNLEVLELTTRIPDNDSNETYEFSKLKRLKVLKLMQLPETIMSQLCLPRLKILEIGKFDHIDVSFPLCLRRPAGFRMKNRKKKLTNINFYGCPFLMVAFLSP
jgi:hypothetical protein